MESDIETISLHNFLKAFPTSIFFYYLDWREVKWSIKMDLIARGSLVCLQKASEWIIAGPKLCKILFILKYLVGT